MITALLAARFAGIWSKLAVGAGIALAVLAVVARAFYAGKSAARSEAAAANTEALKEAKHVADEVHALDRADVDARLSRWMRHDER